MQINALIFAAALDKHSKFINTKFSMLDTIYLECLGDKLKMQSSNGTNYLTSEIQLNSTQDLFKSCVNFMKLRLVLSDLDDEIIDVYEKNEKLFIKSAAGTDKIMIAYWQNFPFKKFDRTTEPIIMPAHSFKNSYKKLASTIDARDVPSPYDFVDVKISRNKLTMCSTNTLEIAKVEYETELEQSAEFSIRKEDFYYLSLIDAADVNVYIEPNQIIYKIGNIELECGRTHKVFPSVKAVFDFFKEARPITLPKINLDKYIAFSETKTLPLNIKIEKNTLILSAENEEGGTNKSYSIEYQGLPVEFTCNLTYLRNFLSAINSKIFYFYLDPRNPTKVLVEDDESNFQKVFGLVAKNG